MTEHETSTPHRGDCEAAARRLYDFLDRRLSEDTVSDVEAHLHHCAGCARHFDFARAVLARVPQALAGDQVSPALRERILSALRAEGYSG